MRHIFNKFVDANRFAIEKAQKYKVFIKRIGSRFRQLWETLKPETQIQECPTCGGVGYLKTKGCDKCNWTGLIRCTNCFGTGDYCRQCFGSGEESCPSCLYERSFACHTCNGSGTV